MIFLGESNWSCCFGSCMDIIFFPALFLKNYFQHQKSPISTHILDTSRGRPADGVLVSLEFQDPNDGNFGKSNFVAVGSGLTDADGRCNHLMSAANNLRVGIYRLTFQTGAYFARLNQDTFFPSVDLVFEVKNLDEQYHVPLLLSAYGYSTYRGS